LKSTKDPDKITELEGRKGEEVNVSMPTSMIKELHAKWLIKPHT